MDIEQKLSMSLDDLTSQSGGGGGGGGGGGRSRKMTRSRQRVRAAPYSRRGGRGGRGGRGRGRGGRGRGRGGGGGGSSSKRVYVGNLSWEVEWQDLKDHMRDAGEVVHADVLKYQDGRSSGGGIVEYATVAAAKKAIRELTDTELDGRPIFVREDRE